MELRGSWGQRRLASQIRDCNLISCTTRLLSQSDTCPRCFEGTLSQRLMSCWAATRTHVWVTSVSFCHCQSICDFHLSFLFFICPILNKYLILNKTHSIHTQLHSQADIFWPHVNSLVWHLAVLHTPAQLCFMYPWMKGVCLCSGRGPQQTS